MNETEVLSFFFEIFLSLFLILDGDYS